ncbi:hypothetical protein B0T16DRAFT_188102 [Cercophora newfieldiana]|uniref:2EXR domain-containing protein n=1 Tax=Cercophora newfieldiana TaxID=92897 RepID=A0AA39Y0G9_9PEZI|nr:hypothetical protein B0T16DRAFT_188102 [Cercophora newfieldiana]
MATEFHPFPMLPGELRDMIWDRAVRPDKPGVHFFAQNGSPRLVGRRVAPKGCQEHPARTLNRKDITPSTYLWDGGLWTACRESYLAMKRAFCQGDRKAVRGFIEPKQSCPCLHEAVEGQHFAVRPWQDLFVFSSHTWRESGWEGLRRWAHLGARDFAVEGDKMLDTLQRSQLPVVWNEFLKTFLGQMWDDKDMTATLWFIDSSLRRVKDVPLQPYQDGTRATFIGCNYRLVQVKAAEVGSVNAPWVSQAFHIGQELRGFAYTKSLGWYSRSLLEAAGLDRGRIKCGVLGREYSHR